MTIAGTGRPLTGLAILSGELQRKSVFSKILSGLLALLGASLTIEIAMAQSSKEAAKSVVAPMTIDYEMEFAVSPDTLWSEVRRLYVEGDRLRNAGFTLKWLENDPTAYIGGYRLEKRNHDGVIVDERVVRITVVDNDKRFAALCADFIHPDGDKLTTFVSYRVVRSQGGARLEIVAHVLTPVLFDDESEINSASVKTKIDQMIAAQKAAFAEILYKQRQRIETAN